MARILVVDDDPAIRDLLLATLGFGAHEVLTAESGDEAVAQAGRAPPDVVVLDLDLPGQDGEAILRRLRGAGVQARVLVLTGSGRGREAAMRAAGAFDYLTKPFSPLELIARLEGALSRA